MFGTEMSNPNDPLSLQLHNRLTDYSLDLGELPFPYEIDQGKQIVYAAVGPWTPEAVSAWVARLLADPAYAPGMRGLLNLRFTAGPLPNVEMMQRIADAMRPLTLLPVRSRWAVLVGSPAMYTRVRLLETLTAGCHVHFRAFDDDAMAWRWLGLEAPY